MSKLNFVKKDGTQAHYSDITYFDIRQTEKMTEEGTFECNGSAMYFERESDEIGQGTLINMDDVITYDFTKDLEGELKPEKEEKEEEQER